MLYFPMAEGAALTRTSTYPNMIVDYDITYQWEGQLATTKAAVSLMAVKSHPDSMEWWFSCHSTSSMAMPTTTGDSIYAGHNASTGYVTSNEMKTLCALKI